MLAQEMEALLEITPKAIDLPVTEIAPEVARAIEHYVARIPKKCKD